MKIAEIGSFGFKSKVVYEKSSPQRPLTASEKAYIDKFDDGDKSDAIYLGSSVTASAYFIPEYGFVIKQGHENKFVPKKNRGELGSLAYENDMLLSIDPKVKHSQYGIAYAETDNRGQYLISTLVHGKPADKDTNPIDSTKMDKLLRTMHRLDKNGIIHSDLSRPNILFDEYGYGNIIDYQYGEKFDLSRKYSNYGITTAQFPFFEAPNNATMFEGAWLSAYLRSMNSYDAKHLLEQYIENKGLYNEKKAKILKGDMSAFEHCKAKAFETPNQDVLNTEVLKMNLLNCHRRQYTAHDPQVISERNILNSISLMIRAKNASQMLEDYQPSKQENIGYVNYMKELGKHWKKILNDWYPSTIKSIHNILAGLEKPAHSRMVFPEKLNDFSGIGVLNIGISSDIPNMNKYDDLKLREILFDSFMKKSISNSAKNEVESILKRVFK